MDCTIFLKGGYTHACEKGHPWVYTDEIENYSGTFENGDIVTVKNSKGNFIGKAFINEKSKIALRFMSREDVEIDKNLIEERITSAMNYRRQIMGEENSFRLIFGEADFLPGMIVDKYEDYYVIQSLALGIDKFKMDVVQILMDKFNAKGVIERSDVKVRNLEGMEERKGFLTEEFNPEIRITENGVKYIVDLLNGQKTGFFLDQKENRRAIHRLVKDKTVLDCFTHTGSFALNAKYAGAKEVTAIDVSNDAILMAKRNGELNDLKVDFLCSNAFDILPTWSKEGRKFDVVILDPPAFTKSRNTINDAVRGYREINLRGIKMVEKEGFLVSCSCSHFMKENVLRQTIVQAARDAGRTLRQVEARQQSSDHPILMTSDESYYLKFFIFQVF